MLQLVVIDRIKDMFALALGTYEAGLAQGAEVLGGDRLLQVQGLIHLTNGHAPTGMDQLQQVFSKVVPDGPDDLR